MKRVSHVATIDEIAKKGWNLNIARFVEKPEEELEIDIQVERKKLFQLEERAKQQEERILAYMRELGL